MENYIGVKIVKAEPQERKALVVMAGAVFLVEKCGANQQKKSIYKITKNQMEFLTKCA